MTSVACCAGACDGMGERRKPILESDISSDRDLWHDPEIGTIDSDVIIEAGQMPSSPSMCST